MINNQAPEKRVTMYSNGHENLDVHSIFYTIQGEGPFCGTPAVFIRLAGCNLQCPACDTDYTSKRGMWSTDEICREVQRVVLWHPSSINNDATSDVAQTKFSGLVVITGGEPMRQSDAVELLALKLQQRHGCYVQIETNGTLPPTDISTINTNVAERRGLYIVCSPKTGKVHPLTAKHACCFKYVMAHDSVAEDGLPMEALDHPANPRLARPPAGWDRPIYLQPQDDGPAHPVRNSMHRTACVESCMKHGYILQLQIHKILGME